MTSRLLFGQHGFTVRVMSLPVGLTASFYIFLWTKRRNPFFKCAVKALYLSYLTELHNLGGRGHIQGHRGGSMGAVGKLVIKLYKINKY